MTNNSTFWGNIKYTSGYALYFLLLFDIFGIPTFADNSLTSITFILAAFLLAIIVLIAFAAIKMVSNRQQQAINIFVEVIILFILSEITVSCFSGEICFFGLFYKLQTLTADSDLVPFRQSRDMAFSLSFLAGCFLFAVQRLILTKRKSDLAAIEFKSSSSQKI